MTSDHLSATFAALSDPTRRAILARLAAGEASVTTLAEPFEMSLPAISKHLKVLERAGLVARGRAAQWRPVPAGSGAAQGRRRLAGALSPASGSRASTDWRTIWRNCRRRETADDRSDNSAADRSLELERFAR